MSFAKYEAFLINNVSTISTLESSLRSITWFLPGRFKDAELASEARSCYALPPRSFPNGTLVTTLMNTMSMYHDTVLAKVVGNNPKYRPLIPSSLHTRYTKAWLSKHTQYKWAARILELLRFTELVIEMCLRRKVSEKLRWRGIVIIEVIKYACIFSPVVSQFTCPQGLPYVSYSSKLPAAHFSLHLFRSVTLTPLCFHLPASRAHQPWRHHPPPFLFPQPQTTSETTTRLYLLTLS